MKLNSNGQDPRRGSALLAAMIVIVILSFAAAGVLSYSLTTYLNSKRQALLDQAKEVADSEMEYLFFQWKSELLQKVPVASLTCITYSTQAPNAACPLCASGATALGPVCGYNMTTTETAFSSNFAGSGWTVSRMLNFIPVPNTSDGGATGLVATGSPMIGHNYYFTAQTSASVVNPVLGTISFHSGRNFLYSSTSLFQFAVFYQGTLELAPGSDMIISGPISTNSSAYIASVSGETLTLQDNVYYYDQYNGGSGSTLLADETLRIPGSGSSTLVDPIFNPNPLDAAPANQQAQQGIQVQQLPMQSSFIGGVDVASDITNYSSAYPTSNDVYRAVIAPPPVNPLTQVPYPEDPVVAASRMYNSEGAVIITINVASSGAQPTVDIGNASNPTAYDSFIPSTVRSGALGSTTAIVTGVRTSIVDPREEANGSTGVNLSTLDVGNLNNVLQGNTVTPGGVLAQIQSATGGGYNGVVYIYDNTNNTNVGAAAGQNAIRIYDGATTPTVNDQNGNPIGFTVVSNNGVYIQGDYNTTTTTVGGVPNSYNPTAIMGDAITAVSAGWMTGTDQPTSGNTIANRVAQQSSNFPFAANGINPATTGTVGGMDVNAAILTGNTPTTGSYASGGAQNLVRMVENWWANGLTLGVNGSLGQLFTSEQFTGPYRSTSPQASLGGDQIYVQPTTRNFSYNSTLSSYPPAGTPKTTAFYRGNFFFW
jgi:hypothetical protein